MSKWRGGKFQGTQVKTSGEFETIDDGKRLLPKTVIESYNPTGPLPISEAIQSSNSQPNTIQESETLSEKDATVNRALNQRRDDDVVQDKSIDLLDIDNAIISYLSDIIKPQITEVDGNVITVPIVYGSPERWASSKKDGFLKDKKGKIQRPIIMIKRTGTQKNQALSTFNRHLSYTWVKPYSQKNLYDKFGVLNGNMIAPNKPVKEIYDITFPDQMIFNYECVVWTDYIEHLNKIVEVINFASHEYWGDPKRFKFYTEIDSYSDQIEVQADSDRIIRTTFTITVKGYLLTEKMENNKSNIIKSLTPRKIVFDVERILKPQ
jgi:hypothetical protein